MVKNCFARHRRPACQGKPLPRRGGGRTAGPGGRRPLLLRVGRARPGGRRAGCESGVTERERSPGRRQPRAAQWPRRWRRNVRSRSSTRRRGRSPVSWRARSSASRRCFGSDQKFSSARIAGPRVLAGTSGRPTGGSDPPAGVSHAQLRGSGSLDAYPAPRYASGPSWDSPVLDAALQVRAQPRTPSAHGRALSAVNPQLLGRA